MDSEFQRFRRRMDNLFADFDRSFGFPMWGTSAPGTVDDFVDSRMLAPPEHAALGAQQHNALTREANAGKDDKGATSSAMVPSSSNNSTALNAWHAPPPLSLTCDIVERDKEYEIHADLPGLKKEDITVGVKDGVLTISGQRTAESKENKDAYRRMERHWGHVSRSLRLPRNVDVAHINAKHENGVLTVSVPKTAPPTAPPASQRVAIA